MKFQSRGIQGCLGTCNLAHSFLCPGMSQDIPRCLKVHVCTIPLGFQDIKTRNKSAVAHTVKCLGISWDVPGRERLGARMHVPGFPRDVRGHPRIYPKTFQLFIVCTSFTGMSQHILLLLYYYTVIPGISYPRTS